MNLAKISKSLFEYIELVKGTKKEVKRKGIYFI